MTTSWRVYSGADEDLLKQTMSELNIDDVEERVGNAIEMAIIGRAKRFIKSSACQRVIDSIWRYGAVLMVDRYTVLKINYSLSAENAYTRHSLITPSFLMYATCISDPLICSNFPIVDV